MLLSAAKWRVIHLMYADRKQKRRSDKLQPCILQENYNSTPFFEQNTQKYTSKYYLNYSKNRIVKIFILSLCWNSLKKQGNFPKSTWSPSVLSAYFSTNSGLKREKQNKKAALKVNNTKTKRSFWCESQNSQTYLYFIIIKYFSEKKNKFSILTKK